MDGNVKKMQERCENDDIDWFVVCSDLFVVCRLDLMYNVSNK